MATRPHSIIILDDYQNASSTADWSQIPKDVKMKVMNTAIDPADLVETLRPYTIIHAMRERTKFPRSVLEHLPNLKFISTTGMRNRGIDLQACEDLGIIVSGTIANGNTASGTVEQTWALIVALSRRIVVEHVNLKGQAPSWQTGVATALSGKTLGLIGVGRIGKAMANVAKAFGMAVVGWSPNLNEERAKEAGVELATSLEDLLTRSDVVSIHIVSSDVTKDLICHHQLEMMKKTAILVNTSRGPIVNEQALLRGLQEGTIAGAGLDVFNEEPLPISHPFRKLENVVLSPHMGYVDDSTMNLFWEQTPENIAAFLNNNPVRVMKPGSDAF
ncbi:BZ3500_MvSof-1268-A1-R1_Chr1-3g02441 [Microbotryum saponariae]|uniref:BZ3500_MvSof-1268-A1-R1_Chr1-3g02441 protein n=1 Tax=Microbotryum saponariae TaxID=289078 RepID=A0A2X0KTF1_9BASI|nr:BZ3500_MvSof-1268-A1-R1_Chr1-3g02441 [Microbotryum saponariae]SCZ96237.1 BZ3501_MvSof-1269-A2-R1_Chr1-3g02044 [Microbotryum saponariae]